jgi:hypothetical protein
MREEHTSDAIRTAGAIQRAAEHLGKEDAASPMGAVEALGKSVEDGSERIAGAISELAEAIRTTEFF